MAALIPAIGKMTSKPDRAQKHGEQTQNLLATAMLAIGAITSQTGKASIAMPMGTPIPAPFCKTNKPEKAAIHTPMATPTPAILETTCMTEKADLIGVIPANIPARGKTANATVKADM